MALDRRGCTGVAIVVAAVIIAAIVSATITTVADAAIGFFIIP
jgi:hypothetical protein